MGFAMLSLLLGSMFNALIFGDISVLISILQQKKAEHQQLIDQSNISMDYIKMDEADEQAIRDYIHQTTNTKQMQEQFVAFMDLIAPSYRLKI